MADTQLEFELNTLRDEKVKLEFELQKHQDLVEVLSWMPAGHELIFFDLDMFLEEMRGKPSYWLPIRECSHRIGKLGPRCLKCRNGDDE